MGVDYGCYKNGLTQTKRAHNRYGTTELNTALTKDQVVEDSCDFQVLILPVSAVICHHQCKDKHTHNMWCSLGVSGMLSV